MNKKVIALVLSLSVISNLSTTAMAYDYAYKEETTKNNDTKQSTQSQDVAWLNGIGYKSISDAVNDAKTGSKITIKGNITLDKEVVIKDKNIILEIEGDTKINRGNVKGAMFTIEGRSYVRFTTRNLISKLTINGESSSSIVNPAIYVKGSAATAVLNNDVIIENNKLVRGKGSAIVNEGTVYLYGVDIRNNTSNSGAIYNNKEASLYIKGGKIHDNIGESLGGAIYNEGFIEMTGGKIYNNKSMIGAGVQNIGTSYTFKMHGGEIYNNDAKKGKGISSNSDGTLVISNKAKIYNGDDVYLQNLESIEVENNLDGFSEENPLVVTVFDEIEGRVVIDFPNEESLNENYKKVKINVKTIKNPEDKSQVICATGEIKELLDDITNPFTDSLATEVKSIFSSEEEVNKIKGKIEEIYKGINQAEINRLSDEIDSIVEYKNYLESNKDLIQSSIINASQLGDYYDDYYYKTKQSWHFDNMDFTGYYLPAGKTSKINVFLEAEEKNNVNLVIRQVGKTENNDYSSLLEETKLLKKGKNTFEFDLSDKKYGYAIFIRNNSTSKAKVRIESVDASAEGSITGTQLSEYPVYVYDENNKDKFWGFVRELREYVKEVEKGNAADMACIEFGRSQFSLEATNLANIYSGITEENAVEKVTYFNSKIEERINLFEKYDGYDKSEPYYSNNHPTYQKVHTMFTSNVSSPSTMYATQGYYHMPAHTAKEYLLGKIMYSWGITHEYGHMLDNRIISIKEVTNNFYSIWGARYQQILDLESDKISEINVKTAYHPELFDRQKDIDNYLNKLINGQASSKLFQNGNVFLKTLVLFNAIHYFDDYDYSNYDYNNSPYTKELAEQVNKYGVYGTAMRILRTDETSVTSITSDKVGRIAVVMTMASGFDYTYVLQKLGANLESKVIDFCGKYPKPSVKLEYFSLDADAKLLEGKQQYDENTVASVKSLRAESNNKVILELTTNNRNESTIGYEVYRDGVLIGFTRSNTYTDTSATKGARHNYTVRSFDFRLTPSSNAI